MPRGHLMIIPGVVICSSPVSFIAEPYRHHEVCCQHVLLNLSTKSRQFTSICACTVWLYLLDLCLLQWTLFPTPLSSKDYTQTCQCEEPEENSNSFSYGNPITVNISVVLLCFTLGYVKKRYLSSIIKLSCSNFLEITDNLVYAFK